MNTSPNAIYVWDDVELSDGILAKVVQVPSGSEFGPDFLYEVAWEEEGMEIRSTIMRDEFTWPIRLVD